MRAVLERLHGESIDDLMRCWQLDLPETEKVESCYHIAMDYWYKVKELFKSRTEYNVEEEIYFFRELKPLFTAHIEYYLILNQGLLFVPDDKEERVLYWKEEFKRQQRYCEKHADFINYFESVRSEYDAAYFLIRNNRQETSPQERIYEDEDCRSSHDYIVRGLMANRMYLKYVEHQLKALFTDDIPESRNK